MRAHLLQDLLRRLSLHHSVAVEPRVATVQNLWHARQCRPGKRCVNRAKRAVKLPGREQSLVETLQEVLLPRGLPDLAGWALATLYEPAGEAIHSLF